MTLDLTHPKVMADRDRGCWLWGGYTLLNGYGIAYSRRRPNGAPGREREYAHRESWKQHRGPIPEGLFVLHRCDVPRCINPDHLFLGTDLDNSRDKWAKGRQGDCRNFGEKNGSSKLTTQQVLAIKQDTRGSRTVAKDYGVSHATIERIRHNKVWAWV